MKISAGILGLATVLAAMPTFAQYAEKDEMEVITVTGVRSSLANSLRDKRNAVGVQDSITAEDIGKFPDLNIAESLQRIPGITLNRSVLGEGSTINLRGLGAQFTRVEINGMTGTSNSTGSRGFSFELLPSELFRNVTVYKSTDAGRTEGGVSGTTSLQTPRPFDLPESQAALSAQGTWSEASNEFDPRIAGIYSRQFDEILGITLAGTYSQTRFVVNEISFSEWRPFRMVTTGDNRLILNNNLPGVEALRPIENIELPNTTLYRVFDQDRETFSGVATAQFRPTESLDIIADVIYSEIDGAEIENRPDLPLEFNVTAPSAYTIDGDRFGSATFLGNQVRIGTRFEPKSDQLFMTTLGAEWQATDRLTVKPFIGYSSREGLDESQLYSFAINGADISFQVDGPVPNFRTSVTDFQSNPEDFGLNVFIFSRNADKDEEFSAKLDFEYETGLFWLPSFEFGGQFRARDAERDNDFALLLRTSSIFGGNPVPTLADAFFLQDFDVGGAPSSAPSQLLSGDPAGIAEVFYNNLDPFTATSEDGFIPTSENNERIREYIISENTFAGYIQGNFVMGPVDVLVGLRVLTTDQTSDGVQISSNVLNEVSFDNDYTEFLPVITARVQAMDELVLRASYSETLTRPTLSDLRPSQSISPGLRTGSGGNPLLQPFTSEQIDIGIEWYFQEEGLIGVTLFDRQLSSIIVNRNNEISATFPSQEDPNVLVTDIINFSQPTNTGEGSATGVEAFLQTPFTFLPGTLSNFGTVLNYTYVDVRGSLPDSVNSEPTTAFPGVSKNAFNAILYYDDGTFSGRLSYSWRDDFEETPLIGRFSHTPFGQLDFSANYNINENFQLNFQAFGLTDEQVITSSRGNPSRVIERERRILVGVRAKF